MTAPWDPESARRLVAELREDDARMTPGPWAADPVVLPSGATTIRATACTCDGKRPSYGFCPACHYVADFVIDESAAGITRLRNNAKPLPDHGDDNRDGIGHQLRYGWPTRSTLLAAAEVVAAYRALIEGGTTKQQTKRLAALRRVNKRKP